MRFGAPLWRIRLDTAADRLALEVRDADLLLASFYTYTCESHTLQELKPPQALTWWQGLEDATEGLVLLHGYGDRKLGQHKGIVALQAPTGEVAWESAELAYYGLAPGGVVAYPAAQPGTGYTLLATATGRPLQALTQVTTAALVEAYSRTRYQGCQYPVLYMEGEEYFVQVQAFVQALLGHEPVRAIEYAEAGTALVVSYYTNTPDGKLDNYVAVFDAEGDLLLKATLGTGLSGIGSDTFFIFKHKLYFIRNKDSLQVYSLLL